MADDQQPNGTSRVSPPDVAVPVSVATTPADLPSAPTLQKEIAAAKLDDEDARLALIEKAKALVHSLETPRETMIRHIWAHNALDTAISCGVQLGLFNYLAEGDDTPKKVVDLADKTGCDPAMLRRLMRHLGSMGSIIETGEDEYKSTNFSKALTLDIIGHGYPVLGGCLVLASAGFHDYAESTGWKEPNSVDNGALQFAYKTKRNMFEHLHAHPPYGEYFNHIMGGYSQGRPSWMDSNCYPVTARLLEGFPPTASAPSSDVLLVDIGGNLGHDLHEFHTKFPTSPGRLILQDLPHIISSIPPQSLASVIKPMAYDFHTEQPIKGARAYYLHSILHDWPDAVCLKILERVKEAMVVGWSRLLINENVMPEKGAAWEATALDVMMMAMLSSRERTKGEWVELIEGVVGLKIVEIWCPRNGVESLIEVERVE